MDQNREHSRAEAALRGFMTRYGPSSGPEASTRLVKELFRVNPDGWQREVLQKFDEGSRRISIRACHGPGKTALAAWLVWKMLLTFFPQKTAATAPTKSQMEDALFAEVESWSRRLPPAIRNLYHFKANRIELAAAPSDSFFSAKTARAEKPEALQGVHSDAGKVLLIGDEASGIPEQIFESAAGSMSGHNATTLLLSNPVRTTGFFYDTHHKLADMWDTFHISADDSPRVSEDFKYDIARRYGEDSNAYRVRVLGEFPKADADTIIPFELIEGARERDVVDFPNAPEVWALDVARFGEDYNVLARRTNRAVLPNIKRWNGVDTMQTVGRVKAEWDNTPEPFRPRVILVDAIGLGAGVADRLRELGLPVVAINVSEMASVNERYVNKRAELWFRARDWLERRDTSLPNPEEPGISAEDRHVRELLLKDLGLLRYKFTSSGRVQAESKAEVKKRGEKSPDVGDAVVMTFAEEAAIISGAYGMAGGSWNRSEPIRRNIPVV